MIDADRSDLELHAARSAERETHQQEVDRLFGLIRRPGSAATIALPKGHSAATAQLVLDALGEADGPLSANDVSERVGISRATAGLRGTEKLDAALRFIVEYQHSYSGVRLVDIEPEVVIAQLGRIIPVMRARLLKLMPGPNGAVKAATAIRVAVSHYIVRSDDDDQFLAQLRHAAGIKQNG